MPRRVVFDTNIIVSTFILKSPGARWLYSLWSKDDDFQSLISDHTIEELKRVVSYPKFKLSQDEQNIVINSYVPFCINCSIPNPPPVIPVCRDATDNCFLELAIAGNADYLISGDKHLLTLKDEFPIIMSLSEFKKN